MTITEPAVDAPCARHPRSRHPGSRQSGRPTPRPAPPKAPRPTRTDVLVEQLFGSILGAMPVQATYLGHRLGWYETLAAHGPLTAPELAQRTDTDARYAREWLEQQTVTRLPPGRGCDHRTGPASLRSCPRPIAPVLADPDDLNYLLPFAYFVAGLGAHIGHDSPRPTGPATGVGWADFGDDPRQAPRPPATGRCSCASSARSSSPRCPVSPEALAEGGRGGRSRNRSRMVVHRGGRVVPAGAGRRLSTSTSRPSSWARRNAAERGVDDRVTFHHADATDPSWEGRYDLVMAQECVHDLPRPRLVPGHHAVHGRGRRHGHRHGRAGRPPLHR